jgi:hypothetical protein
MCIHRWEQSFSLKETQMFRCALVLLTAPIIAGSAQGASTSPVRIEIAASGGFRLQPAFDSTRAAEGGRRARTPTMRSGKVIYTLAPGEALTVVATTDTGHVHLDIIDDGGLLGMAEGNVVAVRNWNGAISFDVEPPRWPVHFRYGVIF